MHRTFLTLLGAAVISTAQATPPQRGESIPRLGGALSEVATLAEQGLARQAQARDFPFVDWDVSGRVEVEVRCDRWDDSMADGLRGAGFKAQSVSERWAVATGWIDPADLRVLSCVPGVAVVHPTYDPVTHVGSVTSQADEHMLSDQARTAFMVDGTGVRVGVLSDSFNDTIGGSISGGVLTGSNPQSTGDLPAQVAVRDNGPGGGTDEGAAMAELIYDIAPGCDISFHSAFNSEADFADGIVELADNGSHVIVDDVIYQNEPMFQDGFVAQSVETVVARGVPYFSSAGNLGSAGVSDTYRDINPADNTESEDPVTGNQLHDWTGAGQAFARITIPVGAAVQVVCQWAEPHSGSLGPGSQGDFDIYLLEGPTLTAGTVAQSTAGQGIIGAPSGDPLEILEFARDGSHPADDYHLIFNWFRGRRDNVPFRIAVFATPSASGSVTFDTQIFNDATIYGHAAAAGASAVAAVNYAEILFGGDLQLPLGRIDVETFSSLGGLLPFHFGGAGNPLPGAPQMRYKPDITAPDTTDTTFFVPGFDFEGNGFPNFPGTSAAAPHAAGVAVLVLDRAADRGQILTPQNVYDTLNTTAIDMQDAGRDFLAGWGRIDALAAVGDVPGPPATEMEIVNVLLGGPAPPVNDTDINMDGFTRVDDLVLRVNMP